MTSFYCTFREMPKARKSRKSASPNNNLNVTSSAQFGQLTQLLGKNPIVLVFVYADWCGHCQHFKPEWKNLTATPNRNMAMVSIRDDAFPKSPLNNLVTPEGYPTVAVVSKANDVSVNLPTRDPTVLKNIVTSANTLTPPTADALNANIENIISGSNETVNYTNGEKEIYEKKNHSAVVPVTSDTITPMSESDFLKNVSESPITAKQLGGGLWSALLGSGASASSIKGGRRRKNTKKRANRRN
jgi:thiol-disulfide isomerase/thioredoxin